jgi:hypothetical protein
VSASLQEWIDSLPDNTRILGPAGARYLVNFTVKVEDRFGLQFDAVDPANPPTFFQNVLRPYGEGNKGNLNREVMRFSYGGGHSLKNWRLQGAQPNSGVDFPFVVDIEDQAGLRVGGVDGFLAEDVFITETAGDFITLVEPRRVGGGPRTPNKNITLRRIVGRKAARQGITPAGVRGGLIEDCDLRDINRSAIDIEPDGDPHVTDLIIRRNYFERFGNLWVAGGAGGSSTIDNIVIEDNEVVGKALGFMLRGSVSYGGTGTPPFLRKSRVYVRRNRAHSIPSINSGNLRVMEFTAIDGVEVADNVVEFNGVYQIKVGAYFNESCGITYTGNSWGNAQYDHEVAVGYDSVTARPITEFDGPNLEWSGCAQLGMSH